MDVTTLGAAYIGEGHSRFYVSASATQLVEVQIVAHYECTAALTKDRLGHYQRDVVHRTRLERPGSQGDR